MTAEHNMVNWKTEQAEQTEGKLWSNEPQTFIQRQSMLPFSFHDSWFLLWYGMGFLILRKSKQFWYSLRCHKTELGNYFFKKINLKLRYSHVLLGNNSYSETNPECSNHKLSCFFLRKDISRLGVSNYTKLWNFGNSYKARASRYVY